ncbi:CLUMA_CG011731, isoform A [Clunio marinus]|uniref:CLUMA_CG011731, isoform A n=1 Tax=Clunio marinus TaxID=568069 RepID=A0A1J1IFQ8_9DIPT|nr:CLUMA_CG011731, isoform A [Clunio marinus]
MSSHEHFQNESSQVKSGPCIKNIKEFNDTSRIKLFNSLSSMPHVYKDQKCITKKPNYGKSPHQHSHNSTFMIHDQIPTSYSGKKRNSSIHNSFVTFYNVGDSETTLFQFSYKSRKVSC